MMRCDERAEAQSWRMEAFHGEAYFSTEHERDTHNSQGESAIITLLAHFAQLATEHVILLVADWWCGGNQRVGNIFTLGLHCATPHTVSALPRSKSH